MLGVRRINLQAYDLWKATAAQHRKIWLQDHTVDFPGYVRVQSGKLEKGSIKRSAGNGKKSLGQEREFCPAEVKKNVPRHILAPSAVARDDLHLRASAHHWHVVPFCSTGKFHRTFLLNKKSPAGTPAPTGNFLIFIFPLSLSSSA